MELCAVDVWHRYTGTSVNLNPLFSLKCVIQDGRTSERPKLTHLLQCGWVCERSDEKICILFEWHFVGDLSLSFPLTHNFRCSYRRKRTFRLAFFTFFSFLLNVLLPHISKECGNAMWWAASKCLLKRVKFCFICEREVYDKKTTWDTNHLNWWVSNLFWPNSNFFW